MNTFSKINVEGVQNFFNSCEVSVNVAALNGAQQHIAEKFAAYCKPRGITVKAFPAPHKVTVFDSNKKKTTHMAAVAAYKGQTGWIVNFDSGKNGTKKKYFKFVSQDEAVCTPLKSFETSKHKKAKIQPLNVEVENALDEQEVLENLLFQLEQD